MDDLREFKRQMQFELMQIRELFITRMTVDSDHHDRRRKDYNQAIFHIESNDDVDIWNADCEKFGLPKKRYGHSYQSWNEIDLDMVLKCWDDAIRDYFRNMEANA